MEKEELKHYLSGKYQGWDSFCNTIVFPIFGKDDYDDMRKKEVLDMLPELDASNTSCFSKLSAFW